MAEIQNTLAAEQVRSARALLQWSQGDLAKAAGVAVSTIADFEKGQRVPIVNNLSAMRGALEAAGVRFSPGGASLLQQLSLFLMSEATGAELQVGYTEEAFTAVGVLLSVFGKVEGEKAFIEPVQMATAALKQDLERLVVKHSATVPQLHQLKKFVYVLRDDEFFLVLPDRADTTAEQLERERLVYRLNHPNEPHEPGGARDLFGLLFTRYDMSSPRTDRPTVIGKAPRARLKCRFCGRTAADGATFKSAAHAIPTALGNDHLKLANECDECNNFFGRQTEPSLVAMLDIQRAFLGTQGRGKKDGRPELQFAEGKVFHDGQKLTVASKEVARDETTGTISVQLGKGSPMVPIAAYKALVKIVLSVIDARELPHLRRTIEWLRYGRHHGQILPTVAASIVDFSPNPSAQIAVYRRKDEASRLPHVIGEFRLGCFIYVFAVPLSDRDSWDLIGFFDDALFRDTFKHYALVANWSQHDLNGQAKIFLAPRINFVPRKP
ncbi:HNH endonuclease [Mesorhizobium sp. M1365]|uniref:HNH endonuclease n=1 Tax=Mesorhizobium sp. M1365 TaxID=2957090 RepID=UPI003336A7A3